MALEPGESIFICMYVDYKKRKSTIREIALVSLKLGGADAKIIKEMRFRNLSCRSRIILMILLATATSANLGR